MCDGHLAVTYRYVYALCFAALRNVYGFDDVSAVFPVRIPLKLYGVSRESTRYFTATVTN